MPEENPILDKRANGSALPPRKDLVTDSGWNGKAEKALDELVAQGRMVSRAKTGDEDGRVPSNDNTGAPGEHKLGHQPGFGLWRNEPADAIAFQQTLRKEWEDE
jgi:hypothetical protein